MFESLTQSPALWFSIPALLGTTVFFLRVLMMLIGGDSGDGSLDVDLDLDAADVGDSGHAFEILSVQSIAAFLMGFGWAGLGGLNGLGWGVGLSMLAGLGGGVLMVWILGLVLKGMYSLESTGIVTIDRCLGTEGEIYATVPPRGGGRGQVRVVVDNRQRIFNAVSDGEELPTSTRVRVTKVNPDHTLTVAEL